MIEWRHHYANCDMGSGKKPTHHMTPQLPPRSLFLSSILDPQGLVLAQRQCAVISEIHTLYLKMSGDNFLEKLKGRCTVLTSDAMAQSFFKGSHLSFHLRRYRVSKLTQVWELVRDRN